MNNLWTNQSKKRIQYTLMFFFAALIAKIVVVFCFGNATPFWDQWEAEGAKLYLPWLNGTLNLTDLLKPHNEHRIFTMRILSLILFLLNGKIWNPLLEMYTNAVIHILALSFFLYFVSKAIEEKYYQSFFIFAFTLFLIPYGWENTLAGFQSQFYLLLLFSFIFFWAITCEDMLTWQWWAGVIAGILCPLSLASGALTLFMGALILLMKRASFSHEGLKTIFVAFTLMVLGGVFFYLTPTVPYHADLKAGNLGEFLIGMFKVAAWPLKNPVLGIVVQAPILIFTSLFLLNQDWRKKSSNWYLFAVAGWVFCQFISIAYGRHLGLLSSRYLDLFSIGLIVNATACFILLEKFCEKIPKIAKVLALVWFLILLMVFSSKLPSISNELNEKKQFSLIQEENIRAYLCTGDDSHLSNKPFLHVPYPDSVYLKRILDDPLIRKILSSNIIEDKTKRIKKSDGSPFCDYERFASPFVLSNSSEFHLEDLANQSNIKFDGLGGSDFEGSRIVGVKVIGSFVKSDSDQGTLKFRLKKGEQILYRSGPRTKRQMILINDGHGKFLTSLPICLNWKSISFSNPDLPSEFDVTIIDAGSAWGEWSAVGFKEKG